MRMLPLAFAMAAANAFALSIETVSHVRRPSSLDFGAEQLSGVTYAGGDLYYAVDDSDNKLYPLELHVNRADGSLAESGIAIGEGVAMAHSSDMEGCAFDPASGSVWVAQETFALIREFNPHTGELMRSAPVPSVQAKCRNNYSLEALTISGDALAMWTANEEALAPDGELATNSVGSVVRLTKFTRQRVSDNWSHSGEWAYETQPIGTAKDSHARSGVSGLCALPDGRLLVLERRCYGGGLFPDFEISIYEVDFTGATDVSQLASLANANYAKTGKTRLWKYSHGSDMPNYEGMCLGPRLDDGSLALVLVSDGGSYAEEGVFTLKLSGINAWSLVFQSPENLASSVVGAPYRIQDGATMKVVLEDAALPPTAYTNNNTVVRDVAWHVDGAAQISGTGPIASWTVSADGVFGWDILSETRVRTPIVGGDTFEELALGAKAWEGGVSHWKGDAVVVGGKPSQDAEKCSMPLAGHAKILSVGDGISRDYGCNATNANQTLDMMVTMRRRLEDSLPSPDAIGRPFQVAVAADRDGFLNIWTADGWQRLSDRSYANGEWLRVSVAFDYGGRRASVCVDGANCGSYTLVESAAACVSELTVVGMCKLDDVYLKVDEENDVVATPDSTIILDDGASLGDLRVTTSSDAAAQALFASSPEKKERFCAQFEPVLAADGKTVSFRIKDDAIANETAKIKAALTSVDMHAVANGEDMESAVTDTTPGFYYTLKAGASPNDGLTMCQSELGDGEDKVFVFRNHGPSGFYTLEVALEREKPYCPGN